MPVGLAVPVLRGIFNLPSAISQEGVGGISTAFFHPERVESTRRVQGAMEQNQPEEQEIDRILSEAKSAEDLGPAFGLFQKLQHEAMASGLVNDEQAYNRVLAPVQGRLASAARKFITGDLNQQAVGTMGLARQLGDKNLQAEAEFMGKQYGRNATAQSALSLSQLRDATPAPPDRGPLVEAQTNWWQNRPYADGGGGGRQPKPYNPVPDMRALTGAMSPGGQFDPSVPPPAPLLQAVNENRRAAGLPPLAADSRVGLNVGGKVAPAGGRSGVASTPMAAVGAALRGEGQPQAIPSGPPAPQPTPMPQQQQAPAGDVMPASVRVKQLVAQGMAPEQALNQVKQELLQERQRAAGR